VRPSKQTLKEEKEKEQFVDEHFSHTPWTKIGGQCVTGETQTEAA